MGLLVLSMGMLATVPVNSVFAQGIPDITPIETMLTNVGYTIDITDDEVVRFVDELRKRDVPLEDVGVVMGNSKLHEIIEGELSNPIVKVVAKREYKKFVKDIKKSDYYKQPTPIQPTPQPVAPTQPQQQTPQELPKIEPLPQLADTYDYGHFEQDSLEREAQLTEEGNVPLIRLTGNETKPTDQPIENQYNYDEEHYESMRQVAKEEQSRLKELGIEESESQPIGIPGSTQPKPPSSGISGTLLLPGIAALLLAGAAILRKRNRNKAFT